MIGNAPSTAQVAYVNCSAQTSAANVIQKLVQVCGKPITTTSGKALRPPENNRVVLFLKVCCGRAAGARACNMLLSMLSDGLGCNRRWSPFRLAVVRTAGAGDQDKHTHARRCLRPLRMVRVSSTMVARMHVHAHLLKLHGPPPPIRTSTCRAPTSTTPVSWCRSCSSSLHTRCA